MIQELNDLIHFVKTSVWRDDELLAFFTKNDPELLQLYRLLWKGDYLNDAAVARAAGLGLTAYKKQARRLQSQLRQMTVFFNDEKAKVDATVKNYVEGTLEVALLNLLQVRGYRHAPLALAKRLYRRGRTYDMPVFVAEALRVQKESVLSLGGQAARFEAYSAEYWEYRRYAEAEERAADCFQRSKLLSLQPAGLQEDWAKQTKACLDMLEPFKGRTPAYLFHVYYYVVRGNYLLETDAFEAALANYTEAIEYLSQKSYPVANSLALFWYCMVPAYIALRRHTEGEAAVLASLDHAPDGSFNFFNASEMYCYLAIHSGNYAQALEIFRTTTQHRRFNGLRPPQRESWHILGAYLFILYRLTGEDWPDAGLPSYRSFRFANETPLNGQDKRGMNVAIQIAFTLLLLLEDRRDDVLERIEALDKYRSRYLQGTRADRSERFVRLLILLAKSGFNPACAAEKTQPLLKCLETLPLRLGNRQLELEVAPYEHLFGLVVEYLSENGRRC